MTSTNLSSISKYHSHKISHRSLSAGNDRKEAAQPSGDEICIGGRSAISAMPSYRHASLTPDAQAFSLAQKNPSEGMYLRNAGEILNEDYRNIWEFDTGYSNNVSPPYPILKDGVAYFYGKGERFDEGKLFAMKDGIKLWEYDTGGEVRPATAPVSMRNSMDSGAP